MPAPSHPLADYNSGMDERPTGNHTDPQWPKLLSLSAHELRSPLSVVAGYIRMLVKERAGPISKQQRQLLEEAERSCGRLSHVLAELSELSQLESGTAPFNRSTVDLTPLLADVVAALPELPDRAMSVVLFAASDASIQGDAVRLKAAFSSILHALRRELVTSDQLAVRVDVADTDGARSVRITIGEPNRMGDLQQLGPTELAAFDEWRGGNGLSLPNARRIIEAHGGRVWSPAGAGQTDGKASAIITLPSSA